MTLSNIGKLIMKTKERNQQAISFTEKQIILLQEEHDIDDEMNEEETKELNDDPYFLLAQRLANAPQVKVRVFFFKYQWFYVLMYIVLILNFEIPQVAYFYFFLMKKLLFFIASYHVTFQCGR